MADSKPTPTVEPGEEGVSEMQVPAAATAEVKEQDTKSSSGDGVTADVPEIWTNKSVKGKQSATYTLFPSELRLPDIEDTGGQLFPAEAQESRRSSLTKKFRTSYQAKTKLQKRHSVLQAAAEQYQHVGVGGAAGEKMSGDGVKTQRGDADISDVISTGKKSRVEDEPEVDLISPASDKASEKSVSSDLSQKELSDPISPISDKLSEKSGVPSEHSQKEPTESIWERIPDPDNPTRILSRVELRTQRIIFLFIILGVNIAMAIVAILSLQEGAFVLAFILFVKAKDCLSVIISAVGMFVNFVKKKRHPPDPIASKWILTLIPAYSESEEQIVKCISAMRDNDVEPHKQVMLVILDGQPRNVQQHMTCVIKSWTRPYITTKFKKGLLKIVAGFIVDVPVIVIEKVSNAGKKDSLVLCHDLFNFPRENIPLYTDLLRREMWRDILPKLTEGHVFASFDMVFCTDADSVIHKGALARLAEAIVRDENCIAACGLVLVELEPGAEWGLWNTFQQLQYTFGQFVRRRAESVIGKVTCLPGCITMIAVRPEMAGAIRKYAEPVKSSPVLLHQVQYLGTDRRLTYSMLSQDKKLHTRFVPEAVSETLVPQSLAHYLSQRRRWGSNAYFNNYFYLSGERQIVITRIAAAMEILRSSLIYYRIVNTVLFIVGLFRFFNIVKILPLLIVSQLPTIWFFFSVFFLEAELRKRWFKLVLGFFVNKIINPFTSIMIFSLVVKNLGSQVWGMTGGTNATAATDPNVPGSTQDTANAQAAQSAHKGGRKLQKKRPLPSHIQSEEKEKKRRSGQPVQRTQSKLQKKKRPPYLPTCHVENRESRVPEVDTESVQTEGSSRWGSFVLEFYGKSSWKWTIVQ